MRMAHGEWHMAQPLQMASVLYPYGTRVTENGSWRNDALDDGTWWWQIVKAHGGMWRM